MFGLTTAATIWFTAAIGRSISGGAYLLSGVTVVAGMMILWLLPPVEHRIDNAREMRKYELTCAASLEKYKSLEQGFTDCGLRVQTHNQLKTSDQMVCSWLASGSTVAHERVLQKLFNDPEIKELRY